jgi:hypothetical protein
MLHQSSGAPGRGEGPAVDSVRRLAQAHDQLSQLVAPATPRTLLLLDNERAGSGNWSFLGPVRLVRTMMATSFAFLVVFILTALSPDVNTGSGDIFHSAGVSLLINEIFLLSAAGIGAAFAALFRANRYIARGTYDPKYETSYWVRFVLGLIAGIVLAALVPVSKGNTFSRPLMALLGGFSASVVYRILERLVSTLESFVRGNIEEVAVAQQQLIRARAEQQLSRRQIQLGAAVVQLREQLKAGASPEAVHAELTRLLDDILPVEVRAAADEQPSPDSEPQPPAEAPARASGPVVDLTGGDVRTSA